jgi:adenosine deaminase
MTTISPDHVRRLPKAELHCHIEGASRASTIRELAASHGVRLPVDDISELYRFSNLDQFLDVYGAVCACLRTADDFRRITYEALEDAVAAGIRYREMFFSPGFVMKLGVPVETVWDGVRAGLLEARADLDITARAILDFDKPSGVAHAREMARFAGAQDRDLLIGMGADSTESGIDHAAFREAYAEAARVGLRRTIHAGEDGPVDHIAIAVRTLGCERVDHGFRLLDDEVLSAEVVDRGIPLTSCPTSNVTIARVVPDIAAHPFDQQRRLGVHVTLNSDDPGMMQWDLADEYAAVADAFGYSLADLENLSLAAIEASWATPDEKRSLRARFLREFDELRVAESHPLR